MGQGHEHETPEHGHHEHSHRESFAIPCGEAFLEAHMHDQAATVSMALCPGEGSCIAFASLTDALQSIASQVEAKGGIVGHIKAFARQEGSFAHASVTEAGREPACEGDAACAFGSEAEIELVAIALLISQDELLDICRSTLLKIA